jgi:hypothetical protein
MAPAYIHQRAPSTHSLTSHAPPSLYNNSTSTPTETSISTSLASYFPPGVPLLEENPSLGGVLERTLHTTLQSPPIFECAFWFLNCSYASADEEEWKTHCLSHFRGEEPPRSVTCPLCDDFSFSCGDSKGETGWYAWEMRMQHVALHHHSRGVGVRRTSRPEFKLYQHLWMKRLIDDQDLKELKGGNYEGRRGVGSFTVTGRPGPGVGPGGRARERERGARSRREGLGGRRQHVGPGVRT